MDGATATGGAAQAGASLLAALLAPVEALRETRANARLARVQLAWAATMVATWAYTVGLTVFAFRQGGAAAVALAVVVRTLPSALVGPAVGALADRRSRLAIMRGAGLGAAAAVAGSAVLVAAGAPAIVVYALGLAVTVAGMAFRTAQSAALPTLTRTPRELASANVLTSAIESAAVFAGPALGAVLLAIGGVTAVLAAGAVLFAAAAAALLGVVTPAPHGPARPRGRAADVRAIVRDRTVLLLLGLLLAQTVVSGGLTVLYALVALDLLGMGDAGVGVLTAAFGLGGVLGSLGTFALAGTRRLVLLLIAGLMLWGLPLVLLGVASAVTAALVLLAAVGVGNVLVDVATVTLLQRAVPDEVLARVFGALETVVVTGLGLGSVAAPVLAGAFAVEGALVAFGLLPPVVAVLCGRALRRLDRAAVLPELELGVLRRLPLFARLPAPVLENLALHAEQVRFAADTRVITEGEVGDRFYAVAEGQLRVTVDGAHVRTLGPGDGFGEIALLRALPRTATVTALDDGLLVAVDREPFIAAVTGDATAAASAAAIVATRMGAGVSRRAG